MLQLLLSTLIIALGWGLTTATRLRTQGNCVSGRIYLNSSARIYAGGIEPDYDQIDPRKFDMAIDYGHSNVKVWLS